MIQKNIILLFIIILPFNLLAQLDIHIELNKTPLYPQDGDTISTCRDSIVIFKAVAILGTDTIPGCDFFWDFDDGTLVSGVEKDSVTYIFHEGGGYRVKLHVISPDNDKGFTIIPVRIAYPPEYSATNTDIPEEQTGICKGSQVMLRGKAVPKLWEDTVLYKVQETPAKEISDTKIYESVLTFDEFALGSTFSVGDLDSIGLNIEHSDMGNLQVKLSCPEGNSVILKNYSTENHAYLGEPVDDDALNEEIGTGFQYFWSESSASGTMNSNTSFTTIPAQSYFPDESFANLTGCSMNGDWKIEVSDNTANDNGYLFSWSIIFKEDIIPPTWCFKDTLIKNYPKNEPLYLTIWEGTNIELTTLQTSADTIIGIANANPDTYGNIGYTFNVVTNWGCPQDTTITVKVEEPSFTATPASGNAKLDVEFKSTTSWGKIFLWKIGDDSPDISDEEFTHKYLEKGDYNVIYKVIDDTECVDYDTLLIKVSVEPSKLGEIPNVFTPNGDGFNDFYKVDVSGMAEFNMSLYNRWGQKIYESEDQEEVSETGWDGKNLIGATISPGVYYYIITGKGKDEKEYEEKGAFHVIR